MTRHHRGHRHHERRSHKEGSSYQKSSGGDGQISTSSKYGVWVAQPTSYEAQTPQQDAKSPHIQLYFSDGTSGTAQADINVKSLDKDTSLVYWINKNFTHPITANLEKLSMGLQKITDNESSDIALDFQRTTPALFDVNAGTLVTADVAGANPKTDILSDLDPILTQAINEKATIYLFGEWYSDSDGEQGIHDVHMNQGNTGDYSNVIYSDGSFMVKFSDHWEAVFLAFATQELPTDDSGDPASGAKPFSQTLASTASSS